MPKSRRMPSWLSQDLQDSRDSQGFLARWAPTGRADPRDLPDTWGMRVPGASRDGTVVRVGWVQRVPPELQGNRVRWAGTVCGGGVDQQDGLVFLVEEGQRVRQAMWGSMVRRVLTS